MPILISWFGDPQDGVVHVVYQQPWDWEDMSASLDKLRAYTQEANSAPAVMIELPPDFLLPATGLSASFSHMRGAYFSRGFDLVVLICTPDMEALINSIARKVVIHPERFFIVHTRAKALALIREQRSKE